MSQNKFLGQNLELVNDSQSQNLLLRYEEPGKPTAQFAYNTPDQQESAQRILQNSGVIINDNIQ